MHFELSDEQLLLQDTVRDLVSQVFTEGRLHAAYAGTTAITRKEGWAALAELGLTGILIPEQFGGSGGSVTDACIVAEALGEGAAPVPFVGSAIGAASVLLHCHGEAGLLTEMAEGSEISLLVGSDLGWPTTDAHIAWDWTEGTRGLTVVDGHAVEVSTAGAIPISPVVDPLHPLGLVEPTSGSSSMKTDGVRRSLATIQVGLAAFGLGLAGRALTTATEYAKEREQYGRPIGSFQAIQHLCADMLVEVETSRSILYGASWLVEHGSLDDAERIGSAALAWVGDASVAVCESSIQVLGGIGVTEEHSAHLRLRSALHHRSSFGGVRGAVATLADRKLIDATKR